MTNTKLPTLLREAERRVNAHVFRRGGDDSLASIPANHERDVDLLLIEAADEIERLRAFIGEIAGWPVAKWMAYEAKKVLSESHEPIAQFPAAGEDHPDLRKVSESAEDVLLLLRHDTCEKIESCEPCKGVRAKAIAEIERLRKALERIADYRKLDDEEALARVAREALVGSSEPRAARDADHCDYPDCEQHWTNVVAQARALLEPLAEHDPAIRQWLKTPDLPTLPGTSRDAPMLPDGFPRQQRDHDTELEAQERRFKAQLRDELTEGPESLVGALQDRLPDLNPGAVRAGRSVKSNASTDASAAGERLLQCDCDHDFGCKEYDPALFRCKKQASGGYYDQPSHLVGTEPGSSNK